MFSDSRNSAMYWLPKIEQLGSIPIPKTVIVPLDVNDTFLWISNPDTAKEIYHNAIESAMAEIGTFPLFLKTDEMAGKHDWKDTCFIPDAESVYLHIHNLICVSEEVDLPVRSLLFREFLQLDSPFSFFHGQMPVAKERRYFIEQGKVICHHAYWHHSAFEKVFVTDDESTKFLRTFKIDQPLAFPTEHRQQILDTLADLNTETEEEIDLLTGYATDIAQVFIADDAWSVDFACDITGKWWCIDMAIASESYHPEECVHAHDWKDIRMEKLKASRNGKTN